LIYSVYWRTFLTNGDEMVLFYTRDLKKEEQIRLLCEELGETPNKLAPKDLKKRLGEILEVPFSGGTSIDQMSSIPVMYQMPEIMIFSGMSDQKLDAFLAEFRNRKISAIPLKAVVTDTNLRWGLYDLIEHLKGEAASFGG